MLAKFPSAEAQCQSREKLPLHMIFTDIVGLTQFKRKVKNGYGKFRYFHHFFYLMFILCIARTNAYSIESRFLKLLRIGFPFEPPPPNLVRKSFGVYSKILLSLYECMKISSYFDFFVIFCSRVHVSLSEILTIL